MTTPDDEAFAPFSQLIAEEKHAALSRFDAEALARRVRHAVAAKPETAPHPATWRLRPILAGIAALALLAASLGGWWGLQRASSVDPTTAAAALQRATFFAAPLATQRPDGIRPPRTTDLEWVLQSIILRTQRACASCPARDGDLVMAIAAAGTGRGGGLAAVGPSDSSAAVPANQPDAPARADRLVRARTRTN